MPQSQARLHSDSVGLIPSPFCKLFTQNQSKGCAMLFEGLFPRVNPSIKLGDSEASCLSHLVVFGFKLAHIKVCHFLSEFAKLFFPSISSVETSPRLNIVLFHSISHVMSVEADSRNQYSLSFPHRKQVSGRLAC